MLKITKADGNTPVGVCSGISADPLPLIFHCAMMSCVIISYQRLQKMLSKDKELQFLCGRICLNVIQLIKQSTIS